MFSVDRPKWFAFCNSIRRRHSYYYYYCRVRAVRVRTGPRRQMWKWFYIYIYMGVCVRVQCALSGGDLISVKTGDPIGVKTHWQPCQSVSQTTSSCTSKYYTLHTRQQLQQSYADLFFSFLFFFFISPLLCLASCSVRPPRSVAATLACLLKLATASPWAPP